MDEADSTEVDWVVLMMRLVPVDGLWLKLVLESSVRSGFLPFFGKTGTETGLSRSEILKKPDQTDEDRSQSVLYGFFRL